MYKGTFVKPQRGVPAVERFWSFICPEPNSGCWLWMGCTDKDGYGLLRVDGQNVRAHRFSYEEFVGPIGDGLLMCHKCDIPSCVNPDHLFPGDNSANQIDAAKKKRHHGQKLAIDDVLEIKTALRRGIHPDDLHGKYGVHVTTIYNIKAGAKWSYVDLR